MNDKHKRAGLETKYVVRYTKNGQQMMVSRNGFAPIFYRDLEEAIDTARRISNMEKMPVSVFCIEEREVSTVAPVREELGQ